MEETNRGGNMAKLEATLKKKEAELKRLKAAEKARVSMQQVWILGLYKRSCVIS